MSLNKLFTAISNIKKYPSVKKCHEIATDPKSTAKQLAALEDHPNVAVVVAVADHEQVSVNTLMNLSRHPDRMVRSTVAEKIYTPVPTLETLAEDNVPTIRLTAQKTLDQIKDAQNNAPRANFTYTEPL